MRGLEKSRKYRCTSRRASHHMRGLEIEEMIITMQPTKAQLANSILTTAHEGEVKLDEATL